MLAWACWCNGMCAEAKRKQAERKEAERKEAERKEAEQEEAQRRRCVAEALHGFIQLSDLEGVVQFTPNQFDWQQLYGPPPLLHFAIIKGLKKERDQQENHVRIVTFMLRTGADPHHPTTYNEPLSKGFWTPVSCYGHSAVSFAVALMTHSEIRDDGIMTTYIKRVLLTIYRSRSEAMIRSVDSGLIDNWSRMRHMIETHNLSFETEEGNVTCHDIVLMAASPVLKAMCTSKMQEGIHKRIRVEKSAAAVSLFLDILYTGSARNDADYKTMLEALDLSHAWDVLSVVQVLSDMLRHQLTEESFIAIANAAVLQGSKALKRHCAAFAARSAKVQTAELSPAALDMCCLLDS